MSNLQSLCRPTPFPEDKERIEKDRTPAKDAWKALVSARANGITLAHRPTLWRSICDRNSQKLALRASRRFDSAWPTLAGVEDMNDEQRAEIGTLRS